MTSRSPTSSIITSGTTPITVNQPRRRVVDQAEAPAHRVDCAELAGTGETVRRPAAARRRRRSGAKCRRAMLTLTTATPERVSASAAVKVRPRTDRHAERVEVMGGHAGEEEPRFAAGLDLGALDLDPAHRRRRRRAESGSRRRRPARPGIASSRAHHVVDAPRHRAVALIRLARHEDPHRGQRRRDRSRYRRAAD